MRTITDHKLSGLNDAIEIIANDQPSDVGANHEYVIFQPMPDRPYNLLGTVVFQKGPIGEKGVNGLSNEALIAIVIDRLRGFQGENPRPEGWNVSTGTAEEVVAHSLRCDKWGSFKCRDNAIAITHLEDALMRLQKRTRDRTARGVEGSMNP